VEVAPRRNDAPLKMAAGNKPMLTKVVVELQVVDSGGRATGGRWSVGCVGFRSVIYKSYHPKSLVIIIFFFLQFNRISAEKMLFSSFFLLPFGGQILPSSTRKDLIYMLGADLGRLHTIQFRYLSTDYTTAIDHTNPT